MSRSISSVGMIILMQHDLEQAVDFYKQLGLRLRFYIKKQWAEFELEGVKIGLCPVKTELPDRRTGVVLNVEDLKAFHQEHKDTVAFLSEPMEKVHGLMVSFKDPGNNYIDLYQPTPKKVCDILESVRKAKSANCQCKQAGRCCKPQERACETVTGPNARA